MGVLVSSPPVGNQVEVQSEPTVNAEELLGVLWRRRRLVLAIVFAVTGVGMLRALLTRPVYEAGVQILIEREQPNVLAFKEVAQVDAERDDYYQTQYKLLRSRALARKVISDLLLLQDPEFEGPEMEGAIDRLLARLEVTPVRSSRLVNVTFESFRPDLAMLVANRVAELYIQQALDFRYQSSSEAVRWLQEQIAEQRKKAGEADAAIQRIKARHGIVNIEERRGLLEQRFKDLGTALTNLKTARLEKEALYQQMRDAQNPLELPDVMSNPVVQSLVTELARLERQEVQLQDGFLEQHPQVIRVSSQIRETRNKIQAAAQHIIRAAENDYKAAAAQEANVALALEAAKAESLGLSRRSLLYDTLKHESEASRQVLNSLLERLKETDVTQQLKSSNIRIVDPAEVPRFPVRPRPARDVVMAAVLGLCLALGSAFLVERFDSSLKTPGDVRRHLGAPLLGVIPDAPGQASDRLLPKPADETLAEGYRILRTSLGYSWSEPGPRIILVTSTIAEEGKTLTSVNLALALASIDGSALLIDADLRRSQAHSLLGALRKPGLTDVLVGNAAPSEVIQRLSDLGLSFLGSGTSAPSPADLMTHHVMRQLLDELRRHYSWIVIDAPPVAAVADPLILAPLSDGVVLVARAEMTPRHAIRQALERIEESGARVLGIVLNRARLDGTRYDLHQGYYRDSQYRPRSRTDSESVKVSKIHEKLVSH